MGGHVPDHDADSALGEVEEMEEVPPNLFGRLDPGRHLGPLEILSHGKELHLEVVGQLHLPGHPLLGQALPDEPVVLQSGAHLTGDGRQELLVAGGEAPAGPPADEVDDTHRPGLPGGGVYRMGTQRRDSLAILAERLTPDAEIPGRPTMRGRPSRKTLAVTASGSDTERGPLRPSSPTAATRSQEVGFGLEDPEGPPLRPQDVTDLPQDHPGGLVEAEEGPRVSLME